MTRTHGQASHTRDIAKIIFFSEMEEWRGQIASGEDEVSISPIFFPSSDYFALPASLYPHLHDINPTSMISRLSCPLTMWSEFYPGWFLTSKVLSDASTGEKVSRRKNAQQGRGNLNQREKVVKGKLWSQGGGSDWAGRVDHKARDGVCPWSDEKSDRGGD